jgi:hypothetical protein
MPPAEPRAPQAPELPALAPQVPQVLPARHQESPALPVPQVLPEPVLRVRPVQAPPGLPVRPQESQAPPVLPGLLPALPGQPGPVPVLQARPVLRRLPVPERQARRACRAQPECRERPECRAPAPGARGPWARAVRFWPEGFAGGSSCPAKPWRVLPSGIRRPTPVPRRRQNIPPARECGCASRTPFYAVFQHKIILLGDGVFQPKFGGRGGRCLRQFPRTVLRTVLR